MKNKKSGVGSKTNKRSKKVEVIKLMLDFLQGPIWISNIETGEPLTGIDIVDKDEEIRKLNYEISNIYSSYYEFNSHNLPCWFNEEKQIADSEKMLDLITKLINRLNEINDGSYVIEDYLTTCYIRLNRIRVKENALKSTLIKRKKIILKLSFSQGPINPSDIKTGETLTDIDIIDNDEMIKKLNFEIHNLYNSYYKYDYYKEYVTFNYFKEKKDKDKMLSLIKKLKDRLNEVNDGSFIVNDQLTDFYLKL